MVKLKEIITTDLVMIRDKTLEVIRRMGIGDQIGEFPLSILGRQ
jgi:hypothetical protein